MSKGPPTRPQVPKTAGPIGVIELIWFPWVPFWSPEGLFDCPSGLFPLLRCYFGARLLLRDCFWFQKLFLKLFTKGVHRPSVGLAISKHTFDIFVCFCVYFCFGVLRFAFRLKRSRLGCSWVDFWCPGGSHGPLLGSFLARRSLIQCDLVAPFCFPEIS